MFSKFCWIYWNFLNLRKTFFRSFPQIFYVSFLKVGFFWHRETSWLEFRIFLSPKDWLQMRIFIIKKLPKSDDWVTQEVLSLSGFWLIAQIAIKYLALKLIYNLSFNFRFRNIKLYAKDWIELQSQQSKIIFFVYCNLCGGVNMREKLREI